jgi:hypothetical protein
MLVLICLSPFVKETSYLQEKPMYHIPQKNEHLHTAGHHNKQENLNLIWKSGMSALFSYSLEGASVESI